MSSQPYEYTTYGRFLLKPGVKKEQIVKAFEEADYEGFAIEENGRLKHDIVETAYYFTNSKSGKVLVFDGRSNSTRSEPFRDVLKVVMPFIEAGAAYKYKLDLESVFRYRIANGNLEINKCNVMIAPEMSMPEGFQGNLFDGI